MMSPFNETQQVSGGNSVPNNFDNDERKKVFEGTASPSDHLQPADYGSITEAAGSMLRQKSDRKRMEKQRKRDARLRVKQIDQLTLNKQEII